MRGIISISNVCLFLCNLLLLAGCNQTFEPIKESESVPLSLYGYLDASIDTQYIRITPIRYQLDQSFEIPEMNIVLQKGDGDETIRFNDSLFQFRQGFNVINAWTTEDIQPEETYQIRAERADGAASRVSITIPKDFPVPELFDYGNGCTAVLRIKGVERLVDVQSKWHVDFLFPTPGGVTIEEKIITLPLRHRAKRIAAGEYEIFIDTYEELIQIEKESLVPGGFIIRPYSRILFIASGGPEWRDEIASIGDLEYALPEGVSNIENGLGYMLGIVSKTVSYYPSPNCSDKLLIP